MVTSGVRQSRKSRNKQRITAVIIFVLIVIAVVFFAKGKGESDRELHDRIMSGSYDLRDKYLENITYEEYLSKFENNVIQKDGSGITIPYTKVISKDRYFENVEENGVSAIYTKSEGEITYSFDVSEEGLYYIDVCYCPVTDNNKQILRTVKINDEIPFEEAKSVNFDRLWTDENREFFMKNDVNVATPVQVQKEESTVKRIEAASMSVVGPLRFYFKKGMNTVTFVSESAEMYVEDVKLIGSKEIVDYEKYLANCKNKGAEVISASEIEGGLITVQAEVPYSKSASVIVPQNDRTSSRTVPYHYTNIVLNVLGGTTWSSAGDSITWEVEVPKSGLYKIGARFMQAENRDFFSSREIKINGELPFKEAAGVKFFYKSEFQLENFGDERGDFYFYLNEGRNTITMTVSLGDLTYAYSQTRTCVKNLNALYRRYVAIMGSSPEKYRDYDILGPIPDVVEILETEYYRLNKIMESLGESMQNSTKTVEIAKLALQMEGLIKKPESIKLELSNFNTNITAISDWMLSIDDQPLQMDYIIVDAEDSTLPKAEDGFFRGFWHGFRSFIGSFTNDYKTIDDTLGSKKEKSIDVWIATATRDQFDVAQKMVINEFANKPYDVNIKMVASGIIMQSTLTGKGPDVALQLDYSSPANFAFRNAGFDLTQFSDFEEVAERFPKAAFEYFEFEGGIYAIPDEMSFPVVFYRKDILEKLGMKVPETWDELEAMVPYLQAENMQVYFGLGGAEGLGAGTGGSGSSLSGLYASLLYQNGVEIFRNDGKECNLDNLDALLLFKKWTEYYTKQGFPVEISVTQRFRTGDVPIVLADYTMINTLYAAAPEINGQWAIAPMLGTRKEDGSIDRTTLLNVGSAMIVKPSVEERGTAEEAWDFLKWWTSKETQLKYAEQQKSILGDAANFPVANVEAALEIADNMGFYDTVKTTLDNVRGIPQVPGGYIASRYVTYAFQSAVENYSEPVEALYKYIRLINKELTIKRKEFGLDY